ncbi:MAG: 50S ribosomal protein L6 [Spirochaetota bacterium]
MSRIGKLPVAIPTGVKVQVKDNLILVEGPRGKLQQKFLPEVEITVDKEQVFVQRKSDSRQARAYHGLYRNLLNNMVSGVSEGFSKTLTINGVGYRAEVKNRSLILNLGYSNPIEYPIPEGLNITVEGGNKIIVSGIDKQQVGQTSAEIRFFRPPEPYKGKGIKYEDEYVRRKIGKSGVK